MGDKKSFALVMSSDAEIAKNNRLALLMEIDRKRREQTSNDVEKQEKETEDTVGKNSGVCEQCGKQRVRLKTAYGKAVCPTCQTLRGVVKNHPEKVVAVYAEIHGHEIGHAVEGVVEGGVDLKRHQGVVEQRDALVEYFFKLAHKLGYNTPKEVDPVEVARDVEKKIGELVANAAKGQALADWEKTILQREKAIQTAEADGNRSSDHAADIEKLKIERDELRELFENLMAIVHPGYTLDMESYQSMLTRLPVDIGQLHEGAEDGARLRTIVNRIKHGVGIDTAVEDDEIVPTLIGLIGLKGNPSLDTDIDRDRYQLMDEVCGQLVALAGVNNLDCSQDGSIEEEIVEELPQYFRSLKTNLDETGEALREMKKAHLLIKQDLDQIRFHLGTGGYNSEEVGLAVLSLMKTLDEYKRHNAELLAGVPARGNDESEPVGSAVQDLTCFLCERKETSADRELLNVCLAVMRGDIAYVADQVELLRGALS